MVLFMQETYPNCKVFPFHNTHNWFCCFVWFSVMRPFVRSPRRVCGTKGEKNKTHCVLLLSLVLRERTRICSKLLESEKKLSHRVVIADCWVTLS